MAGPIRVVASSAPSNEPRQAASAGSARSAATGASGKQKAAASKKRVPLGSQTVYRFTNRGPDRNAVVLVFELRKRTKLELLVKGPGPSCDVVARLPVAGHAGTNRVRFAGRPYGRVLAAGAYALELRTRSTGAALGEVLVGIVPPGTFAVKSQPVPRCESGDRLRPRPSLLLAAGTSGGPTAAPAASEARGSGPTARTGGVLEEVSPERPELPVAEVVDAAGDEGGHLLEYVLVAVMLGAGFALLAGVIESLRRGGPVT